MQVVTTYLAERLLADCVYIKPAHWAACSNIFEKWNLSVSTCGIFPWSLLGLGLRPGRRGFQGGSVRLVKYWRHRLAHEGSPSCYSCQWCQLLSPMPCLIKPPTTSWLSNGDHDADVVETQKMRKTFSNSPSSCFSLPDSQPKFCLKTFTPVQVKSN